MYLRDLSILQCKFQPLEQMQRATQEQQVYNTSNNSATPVTQMRD